MTRMRWWPLPASLATGIALTMAVSVAPAESLAANLSTSGASGPPGVAVTLKLRDAPLTQALDLLMGKANMVIVDNAGLREKTVTVNLTDQPVEMALGKILDPNHVPWYRADDGTFMINATRPGPVASVTNLPVGLIPPAPSPVAFATYRVTEKIELYHISPQEALANLGLPPTGLDRRNDTGNGYNLIDYRDPTGTRAPVAPGTSVASPANPVSNNLTTPDVRNVDNSLIPEQGASPGDSSNRSPEERDQFGQAFGGRRPGFQPNPNIPRTPGTTGATNNTTGAGNTTNAATNRTFVPAGIDLVAGLMTDNSLMVQGNPDDIDELRTIIRLLDVAPTQVSIKVDVINVSINALRQFGGSFNFYNRNVNVGAQIGTVPSGLTFDVIRGNLQGIIGALTTNGRGRVIASPIVTTQNNVAANITQGTTVPVFIPTILQNQGSIVTTTTPVGVQANTTLSVLPRVNRDGSITITGSITVQNITRIVSSPDGSNVAPETNQTALSPFNRRVASGETLVIGGLNTKNESEEEQRIPLLSNIPLVGRLFRSRRRNNTDTQLLIFVTPNIVTEHANTADAPP